MFQNFVASGHYTNQSNQEAYIQAMYRQQYEQHEQNLRSSPSWPASTPSSLDPHELGGHGHPAYTSGHSVSSLRGGGGGSSAGGPSCGANLSPSSLGGSVSGSGGGSGVPGSGQSSGRPGPTPDAYFRNAAAINGLHPYSYAAEAAAAAAAACAWAGRLEHPGSGLGRMTDPTTGASTFSGLASQAVAFRRSGKDESVRCYLKMGMAFCSEATKSEGKVTLGLSSSSSSLFRLDRLSKTPVFSRSCPRAARNSGLPRYMYACVCVYGYDVCKVECIYILVGRGRDDEQLATS